MFYRKRLRTFLTLLLLARCTVPALAADPSERRLDSERLKALKERIGEHLKTTDRKPRTTLFGGRTVDEKLKRMTWQIGDSTREALVYVPESANKKLPLVFVFHGHGGRAEYSVRKMAIHDVWPEAICVYPQGLPTPVPVLDPEGEMSGWQKYVGDQDDRDLQFFDAMLKSLRTDYSVDDESVYSTGHSNGGFFTYVLWAARGDVLAAVAPIAALVDRRDMAQQQPKPVLHIAGENDRIVRFAFQEQTMEQIRRLNGCDPTGRPDGEGCMKYNSDNGPPVITWIHPGAHEIPDGATERIAQFFREHPRK